VTQEAQRDQAMRRMVRSGATIVVVVGYQNATPLESVGAENPEVNFTIIDSVVDLPNVQSVVFKEHEGSFLVGMAAAMASETGKVGFVGGMDIPLIRNFAHGYTQGVKHVNPEAEVLVNMTGTTPAAPGTTRRAAASSRSASSTRASTWSMPRRAPPASACCRRRPIAASSRSASTATRTTCIPEACSPRCSSAWTSPSTTPSPTP
jgi:basic membrane lipoprotein Med (substrate-binding protein (PBP1-ABC) superfamily)